MREMSLGEISELSRLRQALLLEPPDLVCALQVTVTDLSLPPLLPLLAVLLQRSQLCQRLLLQSTFPLLQWLERRRAAPVGKHLPPPS